MEGVGSFVDSEATFAVDSIDLKLTILDVDSFHNFFKVVIVLTHELHGLLLIHPLRDEFL